MAIWKCTVPSYGSNYVEADRVAYGTDVITLVGPDNGVVAVFCIAPGVSVVNRDALKKIDE